MSRQNNWGCLLSLKTNKSEKQNIPKVKKWSKKSIPAPFLWHIPQHFERFHIIELFFKYFYPCFLHLPSNQLALSEVWASVETHGRNFYIWNPCWLFLYPRGKKKKPVSKKKKHPPASLISSFISTPKHCALMVPPHTLSPAHVRGLNNLSHVVMETCLFLYFPQCFVPVFSAATFIRGRFGVWMHSAGFCSSRLSRHDSERRKMKKKKKSTKWSMFFVF